MPGLFLFCRGSGIRTHDLVVPNDARYQAALYPEDGWQKYQIFMNF